MYIPRLTDLQIISLITNLTACNTTDFGLSVDNCQNAAPHVPSGVLIGDRKEWTELDRTKRTCSTEERNGSHTYLLSCPN